MPVCDEEDMLLRTLPSVFALKPDEIVVGFDRCSDRSEELLVKAISDLDPPWLRSLQVKRYGASDGVGWRFRGAYLRRDLYALAENDTILNTSADLSLDPRIRGHLSLIPGCGLVSFGYWDYPWTYQCFMRRLISDHSPIHGFAGLLAFSRDAWLESEDVEDLKRANRAEDTHLHLAIRKIRKTRHVNTGTLHLRPREDTRSHFNRGVAQWEMLHSPPIKPLLHSVAMLRPAVFAGYMHARSLDR